MRRAAPQLFVHDRAGPAREDRARPDDAILLDSQIRVGEGEPLSDALTAWTSTQSPNRAEAVKSAVMLIVVRAAGGVWGNAVR